MDPQARKTKCRLNTLLTPNPSCEVSGSPTGSKSPPTRRPRNPKPPPPEPSGHHQHSAIALPPPRGADGQCLGRAGRQVLSAPLAELPGANVKLRRYLRQPLAAVQQPLHCLRLDLPRDAPSGSPLRHPSLLGCLGSLANPPAPGGKSILKKTVAIF